MTAFRRATFLTRDESRVIAEFGRFPDRFRRGCRGDYDSAIYFLTARRHDELLRSSSSPHRAPARSKDNHTRPPPSSAGPS